MCTEHPEVKEKREFSDTNFRPKGFADVLTECFGIHQGESIQLKHSVETSARFPILKLALENSLFHLVQEPTEKQPLQEAILCVVAVYGSMETRRYYQMYKWAVMCMAFCVD